MKKNAGSGKSECLENSTLFEPTYSYETGFLIRNCANQRKLCLQTLNPASGNFLFPKESGTVDQAWLSLLEDFFNLFCVILNKNGFKNC